jgi:integrase
MRKAFGAGTTLYGGRKGFVDLMLSLGQNLENVSIWLGHKDISTTWEHYKDRDTLSFTPVTAKKRLKSI